MFFMQMLNLLGDGDIHREKEEEETSVDVVIKHLNSCPEPIVIKEFRLKVGAEKVLSSEHLQNQLVKFALVINAFILPPVLFIK